eukprot:CAMPEP_0195123332 /NCGR_PEP_ID=MMETSP0448-20130528/128485_1 /TAXON_ID=66468 /ORGANISM="Heterocapsa triquestra, Strain CCMP 448" /LENGTH=90 /DNA_ID=CAMNT_0040160881 /DNA_START=134 /DNA_END=404 /DNA_ORIENTATION=-
MAEASLAQTRPPPLVGTLGWPGNREADSQDLPQCYDMRMVAQIAVLGAGHRERMRLADEHAEPSILHRCGSRQGRAQECPLDAFRGTTSC